MELGGLVVPLPTLFDDRGAIDRGRNARFARDLNEARVDHLFLLGSLGEFPSIDPAERGPLLESVLETVSGRTDVWVGCGAPATRQAIRYAIEAEEAGASALVAVPPYYLVPTGESIRRYFRSIHESVRVPLIAYNIPSKVGYALAPELVHDLAREKVLVGIKDTAGSIDSVQGFLKGAPDGFLVWPGDDSLVQGALAQGAAGAVMGTANVAPRLARELIEAGRTGNGGGSAELQRLVDRLVSVIALGPFPSTIKFLAQLCRGSEVGYREPFGPLTEPEAAKVRSGLEAIRSELGPYLRD